MSSRIKHSLLLLFISVSSILAQNNHFKEANYFYKNYLFKEAIPLFIKSIKQDQQMIAYGKLGDCYFYTNNPQKAVDAYSKLTDPKLIEEHAILHAHALKMLGKYSAAKNWYHKYRALDTILFDQYKASCDFAAEPKSLLSETYEIRNVELINTIEDEFAPTFFGNNMIFSSSRSVAIQSEDGINWTNDAFNQHYLCKARPDGTINDFSTLRSFIGKDINDAPMSYVKDADFVAITSNNFMSGIRHIANTGIIMDIYTYHLKSMNEWDHSTENFFQFNASKENQQPFSTGHPCFSSDGSKMYFCSDQPGGLGGFDLYVSYRTSNGWSMPKNLGAAINTPGNEMCPFLDGNNRLYFASDYHFGYGGMDIFTAKKMSYGWDNVENLGNRVNSSYDDMYFVFNTQNGIGYFSSNRSGGAGHLDIYQVIQKSEIPEPLPLSMETGDKLILDDRYFSPGNGSVQQLNNSRDILEWIKKMLDNPEKIIQINAYTDAVGTSNNNYILSQTRAKSLADHLISKGIAANRIITKAYGELFPVNKCVDGVECSTKEYAENRRIEIFVVGHLDENKKAVISYKADPAENADELIAKSIETSTPKAVAAPPRKTYVRKDHYAIGDVIEVANIYYEHGKSRVDERKSPGLKQLLSVLEEHKHVVIEIAAHTDNTGSASYNLEFSEKRALNVKRYLENKGISSNRLVAKGYGESEPLVKCSRCSSEQNARNRRTEFKVIGQKGFKVGDIIKVDKINYELNKDKLDMRDSRGLNEIIKLLKSTEISVEIRSHTDSKGSSKYNLELSEKRAKAVYEHLVKNGVNKYRLKYKGYGESMLLNKCADGVRCSDSDHAVNRRTDFKVIGLR